MNTDPLAWMRVGDVWPAQSWTCNCACGLCMSGQCCMDPARPAVTYRVTTGTAVDLPVHEHDYRKLTAKRLFCRTCGETKAV